ncbi:MAG: LPS export ABC transporter ATP-binding protein [Desulfatiglans sp.]|nr:LPS export ABC transporter ATP-binding protein [Desulfatiglans sp.]
MSIPVEKLEARDVAKIYKGKRVVDKINISIERGSIVGLLGPNGAGKTTSFYMMIGRVRPDEGRILLDGNDITDDPMYMRARKGISYLPQEPSVFRKLTVYENILAVVEGNNYSSTEIKERVNRFLDELDIKHLAGQKASSLSGGERRRLEISRALVSEPRFMLLDEPFAGIDPLIINDIKQIIRRLKEKGIGIIITDHNVRETLDVCDAAYLVKQGNIVEYGSPADILNSKVARDVYLGEDFNM